MLIRPFACWSSDSGTVSGTSPVEAGEWKATAAPPTAWRRTSSQTCAWPLTSRAPIVERTQKLAESEAIITRRRGRRSATTPPTRSVHTCASVQAANASPTSDAELLRPRMANATAIGARLVPKNEIVRAANSKRKFRSRRTSRGPGMGGLSPTVRPDGSEQHDPLGAAAAVLVLALALPALPVGPPDPLQ